MKQKSCTRLGIHRLLLASALLLFGSSMITRSAFGLKSGEPAPQFSLKDADGKEIKLADFTGKYVVLEWYNKDCPFVRKHYDSKNMQKLQADLKTKGVAWLQINSAAKGKEGYLEAADAKAQVKKEGAEVAAALLDPDGTVGRLYGAKTTPHMYVINPAGILIYMGAIDSISSADRADIAKAKNYVKIAIDEASAAKPVTVATTSAYGCSVKY